MVALDKQFFYRYGLKPQGRGRWRDESWQAGKSPGRQTAGILSARSHRDTSNSSNTSCANEIIYCGHRFDAETQLYYVRNRTYNPALGRWIQRDPIGYAGGINLYGYVGGAAAGRVDPSGMFFHLYVRGQLFGGRFFYHIEGDLPTKDGETGTLKVALGGQTELIPFIASLLRPEVGLPAAIGDAFLYRIGFRDYARLFGEGKVRITERCGKYQVVGADVGIAIAGRVGYGYYNYLLGKNHRKGGGPGSFGVLASLDLAGKWNSVTGKISVSIDAELAARWVVGWGWFAIGEQFDIHGHLQLLKLSGPAPLAAYR